MLSAKTLHGQVGFLKTVPIDQVFSKEDDAKEEDAEDGIDGSPINTLVDLSDFEDALNNEPTFEKLPRQIPTIIPVWVQPCTFGSMEVCNGERQGPKRVIYQRHVA